MWLFVCCSVGLLARLQKNYRKDFHKAWREDGSRPRMDRNPHKGKAPEIFSHLL